MELGVTRAALQQVAVHILARRRFAVAGRFGLRASPGGFATPAFGDGPEVVRVSGTTLVREVGGEAASMAIRGSTPRQLAAFAAVDLDAPFSCGADTPALAPPDAPLGLDPEAAAVVAAWYALAWEALDAAVAGLPAAAGPAVTQLWPEHFDAATNVAVAGRRDGLRVNLGASPGDGYEDSPYLYVGPWSWDPTDAEAFWNAPFGAVLRWAEVCAASDPAGAALAFFQTGLALAADL